MKKYGEILSACPLFAGMTEEATEAVLTTLGARVWRKKKEAWILPEGSPARYLGIVLQGVAQVVRTDYYGNRSILTCLHPGDIFGEAFACAGMETLPVAVMAVTETEVMMLDASRLSSLENGALTWNLLRVMAQKNMLLNRKIEITNKRTTREKLMAFLMMQAQEKHASAFEISFDRQALADYLGVDRSGLSAEIGKLNKAGVLQCRKNWFELL